MDNQMYALLAFLGVCAVIVAPINYLVGGDFIVSLLVGCRGCLLSYLSYQRIQFSGEKTHLLNMIQNQKYIFRSDVDDECKWHAWGRQISYETLLEHDISDHDWDAFMQEAFVLNTANMRRGLDYIFKLRKPTTHGVSVEDSRSV